MLALSKEKQAGRYHRDRTKVGYSGKESDLEKQCEDYLDAVGLTYIRIPDAVYKGIFGNSHTKPYLKKLISKFLKGVPDITILYPSGKYLCVELKNSKGKQSQGQVNFSRNIKDNYIVIRDLETFVKVVHERGVL